MQQTGVVLTIVLRIRTQVQEYLWYEFLRWSLNVIQCTCVYCVGNQGRLDIYRVEGGREGRGRQVGRQAGEELRHGMQQHEVRFFF